MVTQVMEVRSELGMANGAATVDLVGSVGGARDGPEAPPCAHYWVIEPANGPLSQGICQFCLEVKEFKNFVDSYDPDNR